MKKQKVTLLISIIINLILLIVIIFLCSDRLFNKSIPIEKKNKDELLSSDYYFALFYNDKIYTSKLLDNYSDENINYEAVLDKELGKVIKKEDYWAIGKNGASDGGMEGTLYQLKGYDTDYRLGIMTEDGTLLILDCINGVALNTGGDIFKSRMHVDKYTSYYAKAGEDDSLIFSSAQADYSGSINEEYISDFLSELYEAQVLVLNDAIQSATKDCRCYKLILANEYGISEELTIYESGYACYELAYDKLYFDVADSARILFLYFDAGKSFNKESLIPTNVASDTTALAKIRAATSVASSAAYTLRLHYNGGLYEAAILPRTNIYDIFEENIIAHELETVYGNGDGAWSTDKTELSEVNVTGALYKVRGYSVDERVAIIYEDRYGTLLYVLDRK